MSSGFTKAQLRKIRERDDNRSAWTGVESETLVPQHRANRGSGGAPSLNRLSNGVLIESRINGLIESDAWWAAEARRRGIKISRYENPAEIEVDHAVHGLCYLRDDGEVEPLGTQSTGFLPF